MEIVTILRYGRIEEMNMAPKAHRVAFITFSALLTVASIFGFIMGITSIFCGNWESAFLGFWSFLLLLSMAGISLVLGMNEQG